MSCDRVKSVESDESQATTSQSSREIQTEVSLSETQTKSEACSSDNFEKKETTVIPNSFRVWETIGEKHNFGDGTFQFKVMSYNMLAQDLLERHPYLYTYCNPRNLSWKVRSTRLYAEITSLAPDILCLQEVQASHLNSFYSKLEKHGYRGVFKKKTRSETDGCAIYFKQALFEMEDHINVEFNQPNFFSLLDRNQIGLIVKLKPRNTFGPPVVVATTHLLYNPNRTDVRLAQMQLFLAEIDRFAYCSNGSQSGYLPLILMGDFNSTPDSPVIKLLDERKVSAWTYRNRSGWKRIGVTDYCQHLSVYFNRMVGQPTHFRNTAIYNTDYSKSCTQNCIRTDQFDNMFNSGLIQHVLPLSSVYGGHEDDGTATVHQNYLVPVDYIYYTYDNALKLVERLRMPTIRECKIFGRLPNNECGSDHYSLAATFELRLR